MLSRDELRDALSDMQRYLGSSSIPADAVNLSDFSGSVGDGIVDDTLSVQRALTYCSENNLTCYLPPNKRYLVTRPVYMWGGCSILGGTNSGFYLNTSAPYIFNVGIKARQVLGNPWNGRIENVSFRVIGSGGGRILFFWRSDGARIIKNSFYLGESEYGSMSSGNNNNYVINGHVNCIRKNITISNNRIYAETDIYGSEGIGLNQWDGAVIADNHVHGVSDDMIGIHFSNNIQIYGNTLGGTDGRLYVSNSRNVEIRNNGIYRMPSVSSGEWNVGIALLYIGHELDTTNSNYAPENIIVEDNRLTYPLGSRDIGSAIYLYAPRGVVIRRNTVTNNSVTGSTTGLHLLPYSYVKGVWTDPTGLDKQNVSRVYGATIEENDFASGSVPMTVRMTGATCAQYIGPVVIQNNRAGAYSLICNPTQSGNITVP